MPKMKSRRTVTKRFKLTGSGKLKFKRCGLRHNLEKKSSNSNRRLTKPSIAQSCDEPRLKRALAYN